MCLAIPGKIIDIAAEVDETIRSAKVSFGGVFKDVNLYLTPNAKVGDYVLVHVGVAISIVDDIEAKKIFTYLSDMGEIDEISD